MHPLVNLARCTCTYPGTHYCREGCCTQEARTSVKMLGKAQLQTIGYRVLQRVEAAQEVFTFGLVTSEHDRNGLQLCCLLSQAHWWWALRVSLRLGRHGLRKMFWRRHGTGRVCTRNRCRATRNRCLTSSNKKLVETIIASNSFLLLLVKHLFLVVRHLLLLAWHWPGLHEMPHGFRTKAIVGIPRLVKAFWSVVIAIKTATAYGIRVASCSQPQSMLFVPCTRITPCRVWAKNPFSATKAFPAFLCVFGAARFFPLAIGCFTVLHNVLHRTQHGKRFYAALVISARSAKDL